MKLYRSSFVISTHFNHFTGCIRSCCRLFKYPLRKDNTAYQCIQTVRLLAQVALYKLTRGIITFSCFWLRLIKQYRLYVDICHVNRQRPIRISYLAKSSSAQYVISPETWARTYGEHRRLGMIDISSCSVWEGGQMPIVLELNRAG